MCVLYRILNSYGLLIMTGCLLFLSVSFSSVSFSAVNKEPLRILSWEGYVTPSDLDKVNQLLQEQGYAYKAELVSPLAEGAEQMFDMIRTGKVDISFLTLFFIKMEREQTSRLLQAIKYQGEINMIF